MTPAEKASKAKKDAANPVPWGARRSARRPILYPDVRLKALREGLGLTQRDVSGATGINNATIADAELGFELHLTNALKLAAFFGKPVEEIWPLPKKAK